uniref:Uncharacterized protein n=1 Tax=Oryza punctata TaxID=4537 RepID=A0A0E0JK20_ORYPU
MTTMHFFLGEAPIMHSYWHSINAPKHGGSVMEHEVVYRNREARHLRLYQAYFSDNPTYGLVLFRCRWCKCNCAKAAFQQDGDKNKHVHGQWHSTHGVGLCWPFIHWELAGCPIIDDMVVCCYTTLLNYSRVITTETEGNLYYMLLIR